MGKSLEQEIEETLHTELFVNLYDEVAGHKDAKNKLLDLFNTHCQKRELDRLEDVRHLIQEYSHDRFCEKCQEPATIGCYTTNRKIDNTIAQLKQTSIKDGEE